MHSYIYCKYNLYIQKLKNHFFILFLENCTGVFPLVPYGVFHQDTELSHVDDTAHAVYFSSPVPIFGINETTAYVRKILAHYFLIN